MVPEAAIVIKQADFMVPNIHLTTNDLVAVIPKRCFQRSALQSCFYLVRDVGVMVALYQISAYLDEFLAVSGIASKLHPSIHGLTRFACWSVYWYFGGLQMGGIWVIGHECGHNAFSESRLVCDIVGWLVHSSLGVPYFAWRNGHAQHHASSNHMDLDPVYTPSTRSERGLRPLDSEREEQDGSRITESVKRELMDAIGDSPLGTTTSFLAYVLLGLPFYICENFYSQLFFPWRKDYRKETSPLLTPRQVKGVIMSDIGVLLWLAAMIYWIRLCGFAHFACIYLIPYLGCNHWAIIVTFLQHTDPMLPHFRGSEHTFVRGALSTFDRTSLGEGGKIMAWIGAFTGHGICETHVVHHLCSRIPHYNAWEAKEAVDKRLAEMGLSRQGGPTGWSEMWRVLRQCKFVEDTGGIVFYKNAQGLAAGRAVIQADEGQKPRRD